MCILGDQQGLQEGQEARQTYRLPHVHLCEQLHLPLLAPHPRARPGARRR